MRQPKYVLARDIVIPAGTEINVEPAGMRREIFVPYCGVTISETNDHCSDWSMPLDEALELGIIKPALEQAA